MKKIISYFIVLFISFFCIFNVNAYDVINVSSKNVILYNLNDNNIIYEKDADDKVNIASLTKIMTAIVSIENIGDFDKRVIVNNSMISNLDDDLSKVGFEDGEVVTYDDLLYGTLLQSGADATDILAISISGSTNDFVKLMNNKAKELGMYNTSFSNTYGIEEKNHYSTARDIAILLKYSLENDKFKEIFMTEEYTTSNDKHDITGPLKRISENSELNIDYIIGAKSGYTSKAGLCLASIAKYNGINYLLVTIGANVENKFQNIEDSKIIYEYFFNNYEYKDILLKGDKIVTLSTVYGKDYNILAKEDLKGYLKKSISIEDLKYEYVGKTILDKNTMKGDKIGVYYIKYNDDVLYRETITAPDTVKVTFMYILKLAIIPLIILILLIFILRIRKK